MDKLYSVVKGRRSLDSPGCLGTHEVEKGLFYWLLLVFGSVELTGYRHMFQECKLLSFMTRYLVHYQKEITCFLVETCKLDKFYFTM